MRILTVKQPWAWAIIHGGKSVENRSWSTKYRGPLAIHAGQAWDKNALEDPRIIRAFAKWLGCTNRGIDRWPTYGPLEPDSEREQALFDRGAVIGVVDLAEVLPPGEGVGCRAHRWADPGAYHWWMKGPRPLTVPVPATGRLGLWTPDADLEAQIAANLPGATNA